MRNAFCKTTDETTNAKAIFMQFSILRWLTVFCRFSFRVQLIFFVASDWIFVSFSLFCQFRWKKSVIRSAMLLFIAAIFVITLVIYYLNVNRSCLPERAWNEKFSGGSACNECDLMRKPFQNENKKIQFILRAARVKSSCKQVRIMIISKNSI